MVLWVLIAVLLVGVILWWRGKSLWKTVGMWAVILAGAYLAYELVGKKFISKTGA